MLDDGRIKTANYNASRIWAKGCKEKL